MQMLEAHRFASERKRGPEYGPVGIRVRVPGVAQACIRSQGGKAKQGSRVMVPRVLSRSLYPLPRAAGASPATCGSASSGQCRAFETAGKDRRPCGGMDSAHKEGPPRRAPGFEPRAPLAMWQPVSHAWLSFPPLAWCELLPAANRQLRADARPKSANARWRGDAPANGAGGRSSPHPALAA
jgi:hypothetical protein